MVARARPLSFHAPPCVQGGCLYGEHNACAAESCHLLAKRMAPGLKLARSKPIECSEPQPARSPGPGAGQAASEV